MKLIIRWAIAALALFVAAWLVPGIRVDSSGWGVYVVMAVILGLANAVIRPVLKFVSFPMMMITFGLFTLVVNGVTLWLASQIAVKWFNVGFYVDGFWPALLGALIVSIVTVVLNGVVGEKK